MQKIKKIEAASKQLKFYKHFSRAFLNMGNPNYIISVFRKNIPNGRGHKNSIIGS